MTTWLIERGDDPTNTDYRALFTGTRERAEALTAALVARDPDDAYSADLLPMIAGPGDVPAREG